ncbi:MAG: hypothetical protein WB524_16240, partial [Acidobacteriaceae bacterium]
EVIQQRDADRHSHGEASIDQAPYESNFQPRRKLPPFKRLPWRGPQRGLIGQLASCMASGRNSACAAVPR